MPVLYSKHLYYPLNIKVVLNALACPKCVILITHAPHTTHTHTALERPSTHAWLPSSHSEEGGEGDSSGDDSTSPSVAAPSASQNEAEVPGSRWVHSRAHMHVRDH